MQLSDLSSDRIGSHKRSLYVVELFLRDPWMFSWGFVDQEYPGNEPQNGDTTCTVIQNVIVDISLMLDNV